MHYYIDRASTESFLSTATQRESVLAMANLYGYTPNYMRSSTATLTLTNSGASVSIAENTPFVSTNGLYFFNETSTIIPASSTNTIVVRQGVKYSNESVTSDSNTNSTNSNGNASQRFNIYRQSVDAESVVVTVAEGSFGELKTWARVNNLTSYGPDDSVFTVVVTSSGVTQVVFGNGINGRIPPINSPIKVTYIQCAGAVGNVAAGTITTIGNNLYPTITSVTNAVAAGGGLDFESIDAIKQAIPSMVRTRNGAVTLSDFADIALTIQGVSKAVVSYLGSSSTGASITATVIDRQSSYLTDGAASVSIPQTLRDRVSRELIDNAMLGVTLINVPSSVSFTKIYVYLDLYVTSNYIQSVVKAEVQSALESLFSFENVSFGDTVTVGEIYRTAMAITGVDYVIIKGFTTSTAGTPATTIDNSGKITVANNQLPKLGIVSITPNGGVTAV
jgi:predicted phage baseplate assembly protein